MNDRNLAMLKNLTFKTIIYHKNFDLLNENESFITEHAGTITKTRMSEYKPPIIIGEFGLSVWNIKLGDLFCVDFMKLIKEHNENAYVELIKEIKERNIDIYKYKKIIIIHSYVLREDHRKHEVTEEFIEYIYRNFYDDNNAIIALVKPFQDNLIDADYYIRRKFIQIKDELGEIDNIPAAKYYNLNEFKLKKDIEDNELKLYIIAARCGFNRIGESHLFQLNPDKILNRMREKYFLKS